MRWLLLILAVLVVSCGVSRRTTYTGGESGSPNSGSGQAPVMMSVSSHDEMRASLMQAYRDWKGTPYVLGGSSASGVDCSSFISIVFDRYFGVDLPPNTRKLMGEGDGIRRVALRTGDLIFFHTGRNTLHAGIMVNDDEFLHASTSQGVMISNLYENYWAARYLAARRIF